MARAFVSASSQAMQSSTLALSTFNQCSISFWLKWTSFANDDKLAMEYSPNAGTNNGSFFIDPNSSTSTLFDFEWNSAAAITKVKFARPSAGAYHHYIFQIDGTKTGAAAIPVIYVDGVSQSLTSVLTNALASSFSNYNLNFMCRNQASLFADGSMADVAVWASSSNGNALLTQLEATALAQGARPINIRTASLQYWWPIDGIASPEPDFGGTAKNATLTGSPASAFGPPMMQFTPRWPLNSPIVIPASSFQPAWAIRTRIVVDGIGI